ncbi:MAG: uroporphyrinogen-III synthase [Desulfurococcales archaeon]|nr:uroporphyrinogen-III synthase [Desulfurococcales archaeon]
MRRKCRVLVMGPEPPRHGNPMVEVLWIPVIKVRRVGGSSLRVVSLLESADTVAFTSPRGPRLLKEDSEIYSVYNMLRASLQERLKAVIGPETGRAFYESFRLHWDIMPEEYRGEALGLVLARSGSRRVVIARSRNGGRDILEVLESNGVEFYDIPVYDVDVDMERVSIVASIIMEGRVDVVAFTSGNIASALCRVLKGWEGLPHIVSIGPTTAGVIRKECGVEPRISEKSSYEHLIKKAVSLCGGF